MKNNHFNKIKKMFGAFSSSYDIGLGLCGFSENSKIREESIEALDTKPNDKVFDVCCGTGLNFKLLENKIGNGGKIIGVDLTPQMLDVAKKNSNKKGFKNIDLINANILSFHANTIGGTLLKIYTLQS